VTQPSPFDHRQDRELGEALRSALSGKNEAAFVESVVARAASFQASAAERGDWWEVLGAWARPGIAAAAIGLAASLVFLWGGFRASADPAAVLGDPLQASGEIPDVFLATQAPDLNEVLALELGN